MTEHELASVCGGAEEPGWGERLLRYVGAGVFGGIGSLAGPVVGTAAGAFGYDYGASAGRALDQGRQPANPTTYGTFPTGGSGGGRKDARVCFVAGTTVSTPHGRVPIEMIEHGDLVYAWDARRDALGVTRVICLETHDHETVETFALSFGESSIRVTKGHPFWTGHDWITSENLRSGVNLLAITGRRSVIAVVREAAELRTVYNVRTEAGTYLVGAAGVVVSGLPAQLAVIPRAA